MEINCAIAGQARNDELLIHPPSYKMHVISSEAETSTTPI